MQKLGIVAGAGELPSLVAQMAVAKSITPVIVTLDNQGQADFAPLTSHSYSLLQIESIIAHFIAHEVTDIVMVGKVQRPVVTAGSAIDATSAELLKKTLPHGDDAALRAVLGVVQQAGLRVLPLQALVPEQKLAEGYDNNVGSGCSDKTLTLAIKAHKRLSALDVGQAVIVQEERVIAIEAAEGTDAMIARSAGLLSDEGAALFFKASKTSQNKLLDPPVIGLDTITHCIKAGVRTIAIEAEHCLLAAPLPVIEEACAKHDIRLMAVSLHEAVA